MDPDHDAAVALSHAFALAPLEERLEAGGPVSLAEVKAYLIEHITRLLDRNPAMLLSILYRIDVAEGDVKRVFEEAAPPRVPDELADLIIERQLQKVRTRRQHRTREGDAGL